MFCTSNSHDWYFPPAGVQRVKKKNMNQNLLIQPFLLPSLIIYWFIQSERTLTTGYIEIQRFCVCHSVNLQN